LSGPFSTFIGGDAAGDVIAGDFEILRGGSGNDALAAPRAFGEAGDDLLSGGTLDGGAGNDTLLGGAGGDALRGGTGNDRLEGGAGADTLGGGGEAGDIASYANSAAVRVLLDALGAASGANAAGGEAEGDLLDGIAGLIGSAFADTLRGRDLDGGAGGDSLLGLDAGGSKLRGGEGNDALLGGAAADSLAGGADGDTLSGGGGNDALEGGTGNDSLVGSLGADTIAGGGQAGDVLSYAGSAAGVRVLLDALGAASGADVAGGDAAGDVLSGIAILLGSAFNDTLRGFDVDGGAGRDSLRAADGPGSVLRGGAGNDTLLGDSGSDLLDGGDGNDSLRGRGGADSLLGGAGADSLAGRGGADWLDGGLGADAFLFAAAAQGADTISGYVAAEDQVFVSAGGFGGGLTLGALRAQAFTTNDLGVATTSQHRFIWEGDAQRLWFDVDGIRSAAAVQVAVFTGTVTLTAGEITVIA
jgi:Ca2+-binding RTX toxin-like protein